MEDFLSKLELGCLNDSAEKFFATQCNSKEAVCLLLADGIVNHGSTTLQYISGNEAACRQADFKVWFEAPLGMPGLSWRPGEQACDCPLHGGHHQVYQAQAW